MGALAAGMGRAHVALADRRILDMSHTGMPLHAPADDRKGSWMVRRVLEGECGPREVSRACPSQPRVSCARREYCKLVGPGEFRFDEWCSRSCHRGSHLSAMGSGRLVLDLDVAGSEWSVSELVKDLQAWASLHADGTRRGGAATALPPLQTCSNPQGHVLPGIVFCIWGAYMLLQVDHGDLSLPLCACRRRCHSPWFEPRLTSSPPAHLAGQPHVAVAQLSAALPRAGLVPL